MKLELLRDKDILLSKLAADPIENAGFLFRAGELDLEFYADDGLKAALAVPKEGDHCLFWGDWSDIQLPLEILPEQGIFTSACSPHIISILKKHMKLEGEWPCWHYLAPEGYGSGEWDDLGPLTMADVPLVTKYWELGGDDREEHIRDSIARFDSSCIRKDEKPVAWTGQHFETESVGNLGFAHTLEEHRRKGYQQLVTKALVNRLAARGMRTTCHVITDNEASMKLCESLGFEIVGEQTWAYFTRK